MKFYRKHIKVKAILKEDISDKIADELGLTKKRKGTEIEIPWWAAEILLEKGIIEFEAPKVDEAYIQKKVWSERATTKITDLDKDFYLRIFNKLNKLKKENSISPSPMLIKQIENIEIPLNDLISIRISKILKMAYRGGSPSSLEKLTIEEKWLYDNIEKIIKLWMKNILGE